MAMIQELMNAFADSDLDCANWNDSALKDLSIIALETLRVGWRHVPNGTISRSECESFIDELLKDA